MSVSLTVNGTSYNYPQTGDVNWGVQATNWASSVTSGMLQKAGGSFTLTAEVDFGATYGLKTAYYKTQTANNASAGAYRLARTDVVSWRNQANGANLDLGVSSSNILQFNGEDIIAGAIVNADISASAAIAFSKMAALTAARLLVSDGSGVVSASSVTSTEAGYLSGVTSAIQTQLAARLPLAGGTMTGDLFLNADPSASNQAATKNYVDNASAGNVNNFTVRVASTGNVNLANEIENGDTQDGVVLATGDLFLAKNQSSTPENGIYVVPASGAASRYTGMDTWTEAIGASVFVTAGTAGAGTNWKFNTAAGGTLGVTAIPIVQNGTSQVYSASGEGIELSGTTFSLELDGATLTKSGSGLKVTDLGIANAQVSASAAIALSKLAATTASRALVSDGSGFVSAATTTATEIGYVNGVTSAIQTQIDAKIPKTLTTTRGDMIYASAANTPARLAVGTSGYIIQSDGTDPVWTSPKVSVTRVVQATDTLTVPTSWTKISGTPTRTTLAGTALSTFSNNRMTFPLTGYYLITLILGGLRTTSGSSIRSVLVRAYNFTDSTVGEIGEQMGAPVATGSNSGSSQTTVIPINCTDISKSWDLQWAASGSNVVCSSVSSIDSQAPYLYTYIVERIAFQ